MAAVSLVAGSRDAAEDAVQEALVRAWERSPDIDIMSLPAWVTRVSLNLAKSRLRRVRAESRARARLGPATERPEPGAANTDVERALRSLSRRQREVVVLRYYLGMDVAEIADVLAVSEGTIKTLLFRARRALAELLRDGEEQEVEDHARLR